MVSLSISCELAFMQPLGGRWMLLVFHHEQARYVAIGYKLSFLLTFVFLFIVFFFFNHAVKGL